MDSDQCHLILFYKAAFLNNIINTKNVQHEHSNIL